MDRLHIQKGDVWQNVENFYSINKMQKAKFKPINHDKSSQKFPVRPQIVFIISFFCAPCIKSFRKIMLGSGFGDEFSILMLRATFEVVSPWLTVVNRG